MLTAAAIALVLSLLGTKVLIEILIKRRIGQPIHEDLPTHQVKAGTPNMGGIAIVISASAGYALANLLTKFGSSKQVAFTYTGLFTMITIIGASLVGFLDDYIKVRNERNLGLSKRAKSVGLLIVACGFPLLMLNFTEQSRTISFTRFNVPGWDIGAVGWFLLAAFVIVGVTNAVNLTDGMDGLAAGSGAFSFMAFMVIGFWSFRHPDIYALAYTNSHALDLAVVAAAMLGACTGFLWWNAAPAQIFMGDTGSLAIGAALACLALTTNTLLLLIVVGGIYAVETLSVIIQVASFRLLGGRRPFRMAPIHHHFEQLGWPETTVIIRFWILAGLLTALALGFYYADFLSSGAID